tara:strand:+ start:767 stop:1093 length:327 start_codon:yes stop_codon:yes gene_type:complete
MKNIFIILVSFLALSACVSNDTVQTVEIRDFDLNCDQLKYELTQLGVKFEEAEGDSGLTTKNVALGIFFWPGIIVNERQAGRNEDSINKRIEHLNGLYIDKCVGQSVD